MTEYRPWWEVNPKLAEKVAAEKKRQSSLIGNYEFSDQARAKKFDEKLNGLAQDDPLTVKKITQKVYTAKGELERTFEVIQRKKDAEIYRHLTPERRDARNEIEICFKIGTQAIGMKTAKVYFERVTGRTVEDWATEYTQKEKNYIEWRKQLSSRRKILDTCIEICGMGRNINEAADQVGVHRETASIYLKDGLDEYCYIAGWRRR